MKKILFLASICLMVCVSVAASGETTWYVKGSVPASGDGSLGDPFKTIQEGIDAASDGDTVIVAQGTYVENIHFDGKNITLISTEPLDPTIVAGTIIDGNQAGSVVTFDGTEGKTCILSGFTITNGSGSTVNPYSRDGGGIWGGERYSDIHTHATIENNVITANSTVEDGDGGGVFSCDGIIQNNIISDNWAGDDGGGVAFCHGLIQNNEISGNTAVAGGGGLYDCAGTIQNNTVSGNTAWSGGGVCRCHGPIQNNLITGNFANEYAGGGLYDCHGPILNNTIVGNSAAQYGGGVEFCEGTVVNCIIWGNTAPEDPQLSVWIVPRYSCIQNWTGGGVGNIAPDDPPFVPEGGDFRLDGDSPCIDAGANFYWLAWPQRDMDGNCRLAGTSVDMGCYEYGSSVDADGDLLSDADEGDPLPDPLNDDTDGDGLRDGLEILRGSNPLVTTPSATINISGDASAIQQALCLGINGDEIIVAPGTYQVNLVFCGADVILRSSAPEDPAIVASTILDGGGMGRVVALSGYESGACVLSGFTIQNGVAYHGAGIFGNLCTMGAIGGAASRASDATIENNVIARNSAVWRGGGLQSCGGLIRNNTITNNSSDHGDAGGLVWCHGTIENNVISGNWAKYYAGGLDGCDGTIQNNVITGNSAILYDGGGFDHCDGTIQNNLIINNSAGRNGGGLIYCHGTIRNNTIAHNSAEERGGGLYWCNAPILNSIIWGNTAPRDPQIYVVRGGSKPTYCCIEGKAPGEGNITEDPQFVAPNDYHLQAGSPCIDAGMNEDWMADADAVDLDGNPRISNGTVDMGAYEWFGSVPPVVYIISPTDVSFESGETIVFEGSVTDTEDDDAQLTAELVWESSKDGYLHTGGSFSATLSDGNHIITASVTDSKGATGSDSVTITVGTLRPLNVVVTPYEPEYKMGETVGIKVVVTDDGGSAVSEADVHVEVTTPKGNTYGYDGRTGQNGIAYLFHKTHNKDGTGTYSVTATASHPDYKPGSGDTTFDVYK